MINIYYLEKDNIPFYVGKTNNPTYRLKNHKKKLGDNNINLIVVDTINNNEWKFWEQYWICQFKAWGFTLINKNNGGGGPEEYNEDQKQRMRKPKPGAGKRGPRGEEFKQKLRKPKSDSHKNNISQSQKGKPKPGKYKPILQYDKQNHFIREWSSIQEASKYIKGDIGAAVRGKQKIAGNFIWKAK